MRDVKSFTVLVALLLIVGVAALAEEKTGADAAATPAAAKADAAPEKPAKKIRLTKPWSGLDTLSEDQKQKIADIHAKAVAEIKAIEQREREEIMALLTDEQKAQLEEMAAQEKAKRKSKASEKSAAAAEGDEAADADEKPADDNAAGM